MSNNEDLPQSIELSYINIINPESSDNVKNNDSIIENSVSDATAFDENDTKKKKVHFPEDNEIVSDYFESKNYWAEHKFCSSEELINSYKKACEFCNTKPIPILLEQLKGIDARLCHERYDMLNMSNVKLDLKQIECMEEIFKRVQFKSLNFENTNLDDESSASLFEIIEYYESCSKLNISLNSKISYNGFNACSKMLKKTPFLECIELKGIMFTDATIPPLNRALRCGSNLKSLHLENSNICSKNLLILTSALKLNMNLKELHLSSNRMVPSDGIQLGSLLKVNRHIEILDVRNNSLGDIGLSHVCDGLCEQSVPQPNKGEDENEGKGLLSLVLWSNSITFNGMPALSEALKVNRSLHSLNLGNNPISSEGIHALRDGLLVNRSLKRLSLPCCRITCEGGVAIAEYLADTKQLLRLDLRDNDIRTAGLMAISHSMKVNKSLIRLDLDQVSKRDPVRFLNVKGFLETQLDSLRIIQERIQENKKAVIKNQEMNLAHDSQSLSNNLNSVIETSSESLLLLPIVVSAESSSSETTNAENQIVFPETIISDNENSVDLFSENNVQISNLSLDLSIEMETSFELPSNESNKFSNKVLSPTDTILEFKNSESVLIGYDINNHTYSNPECDQENSVNTNNTEPIIKKETPENLTVMTEQDILFSVSNTVNKSNLSYVDIRLSDEIYPFCDSFKLMDELNAEVNNVTNLTADILNGVNVSFNEQTNEDLNILKRIASNEVIDE